MRSRFLAIIPVVTLALVGATPAIASTDICAVAAGTLGLSGTAAAQAYPDKVVRLIVPRLEGLQSALQAYRAGIIGD